MKTTYFYGDLARYTGKTMTIHGGLFYEIEIVEGNLKGQLKQADRAGADWTLILTEDGTAELKQMETGEQRAVEPSEVPALILG